MTADNFWGCIKRRAALYYYARKARNIRSGEFSHLSGRVLVAGLLSSPNGIGRGGRLICHGLNELGYDVATLDLSPVIQPDLSKVPLPEMALDDGKGPIILHVNPTEVPKALHLLRHRNVKNRRLIGVWAWELETVPDVFNSIAKLFDEVWSISQFSKDSFQNLPVPVVNMGYPITQVCTPISVDWRVKLKLSHEFLILTSFDSRSSVSRKNPEGAVRAFLEAFRDNSNVKLIVKATGKLNVEDKAVFDAENIEVIEDILSENEMTDLIRSCDCYLSLTRAEGFGLVAAEAASYGISTIITGWSAPAEWSECPCVYHVDYELTPTKDAHNVYDDKKGRRWAEPKITHAANLLKHVVGQKMSKRQVLAEQSIKWWRDNYGVEAYESRLSSTTRLSMTKKADT